MVTSRGDSVIENSAAYREYERQYKPGEQARGPTQEQIWKRGGSRAGGADGIHSVAVKCVDIRRTTSGEGGLLDSNLR